MFLYCLDLYDVCMTYMESNARVDPKTRNAVKQSLTTFMIHHFVALNERIPGQMKGWTQGMFIYVCWCALTTLGSPCRCVVDRDWMFEYRLCMTYSMNVSEWSFFTWCKSLDVLERQWHVVPKDDTLVAYINALEYRASQFVSYLLPGDVMDIPAYRVSCGEKYRIHPAGIYQCYCRMIVLKRSLAHLAFFNKHVVAAPLLDDTYLKTFLLEERRHLTIRKFRDNVSSQVFINMLRDSDRFRVSYDRRGSAVSPYAALANFRPLAMPDLLSKSIAYDKPEVLLDNKKVPDALYLCMVHAYFSSTYNVSFRDMFLCSEENAWGYREQIVTTTVPIILQICHNYHVFARGQLYQTDGTFYHAFYAWVKLVKTMYHGILYSQMDVSHLCKKIVEPPQVIDARKTRFVEYHWD